MRNNEEGTSIECQFSISLIPSLFSSQLTEDISVCLHGCECIRALQQFLIWGNHNTCVKFKWHDAEILFMSNVSVR